MDEFVRDLEQASKILVCRLKKNGQLQSVKEDVDLMPLYLLRKVSPLMNWELTTGFQESTTRNIIERATQFLIRNGRSKFNNAECVYLALLWYRSGYNCTKIADHIGENQQVITRAICSGIKALAACFEPFCAYGGAPKLSQYLSSEKLVGIPQEALDSQFICDGKHIRAKRLSSLEEASTYFSKKLCTIGYQFQCIVTHMGQCVFVSNGERAAVHDMTVYRNNRTILLAGLSAVGISRPIILADQGYENSEFPELFVPKKPSEALNARRLIVENYFGRMSKVFGIVKHRFPFNYEMLNPYLRRLYFLTNVHIFQKSLRKHKYRHHLAQIEEWLQKLEERKMTHRETVRKSRAEATSRISKLRAERMLNAKTDLELVATQFSQPSSQSPS